MVSLIQSQNAVISCDKLLLSVKFHGPVAMGLRRSPRGIEFRLFAVFVSCRR